MKVEESLNVTFDETLPPPKTSPLKDDDLVEEKAIKKQTSLAISTTEAEYVSAGKACQQALWMKQAFIDYGISEDLNWIEFLLTRPQPPPQVQRDYRPTTTSTPNSPPTTN
nr:retrovirus-related Pol polyprotein from transposon TNT 1-94 [Tanacetum cinerariifolium]GEV48527.1 retrovirus-related Pol polyprotein from transposon TNT 1-94 [Tanacetum cinerariifolium]